MNIRATSNERYWNSPPAFFSGLLICAMLMNAAPLQAQTLKTVPATGHPGLAITVSASGFGNSEAVDVYFDTVDTLLLVTTATGTLSGSVTLPASAQPGKHYVTAIGRHSGDAAQFAVTVSTPWNEWGFGAGGQGFNPFENTIDTSNVGQLGLLWAANESISSIQNDGVVVASGRVISALNSGGIQSRSTTTGAVQWSALTTVQFGAGPALSGGNVYVGGYNGTSTAVYAVKTTGASVWTSPAVNAGIESSPVVVNGIVYVGCLDQNVYAFNATTGALVWQYFTGGSIYSSPAVVNGIVYMGSSNGYVYALNAASGVLIWKYMTANSVFGSPAVASNRVFIGSLDKNLYALDANSGGLLWKVAVNGTIESNAAVANGRVYVAAAGGTVYSIAAKTGAIDWTYNNTSGFIYSGPIVANGVVYFGDDAGTITALDAAAGNELASAQAILDSSIQGMSISDGVLYFNSYNYTAAYGLQAGTDSIHKTVMAPLPSSLVPDMSLTPISSIAIKDLDQPTVLER